MARAEIGVFGGSGFYSFLEDFEQVEVETPFGNPSAPFTIGDIGGKSVAFLPRHGLNHEFPARDPAQGEEVSFDRRRATRGAAE